LCAACGALGPPPPVADRYNCRMAAPSDADLRAAADSLAQRMLASDRTVVTAESCTGGWIGKVCTDLPGSSRWYLGGVVSYANEAKAGLLGVESALLQAHGAVSESVARAMAQGALEQLGGDLSVAVSGIAGPDGGTPDKPVGTVWFAWARRLPGGDQDVSAACERFPGDRDEIRRWSVQRALAGLLER
jgi:nicotinamide-nucleotide amidase